MTTVSYFALMYAATLWLSRFLLRYMQPEMFLDQPTERKLHTEAKPRFGGIAFGIAIIVIGWFLLNQHMQFSWYFIGGIAMFGLGAIDDFWSISWRIKLPAQLFTAFFVVVQFVQDLPIITFFGFTLPDNPILISAIFVFWFVGIVNAVNLIDGMDGLAGGYIFLTSFFALIIGWLTENREFVYFNTIYMGAMAAFLHFNQRPAKFFMGDSGSLLLGFHVAVLPILFYSTQKNTTPLNMTPFLLISSYLIIDTARVFYDRLRKHLHPLEPDQNHLHHLLYHQTASYKGTLLVIFVYLSIFGVFGVISQFSPPGTIPMLMYFGMIGGLILVTRLTDFGILVAHKVIDRFNWDENQLPGYQLLVRIRFLPMLSLIYFLSLIALLVQSESWISAGPLLLFSLFLILLFSARGSLFPKNAEILLIGIGIVQVYILNGIQSMSGEMGILSSFSVANIIRYISLGFLSVIATVNYIARSKRLGPDFWNISDLLILFILVGMASLQPLGIGISVPMTIELGMLYLANKLGLPRLIGFLSKFKKADSNVQLSPE